MTRTKLIAARDPTGIRPLSWVISTASLSSVPKPVRLTLSARNSYATWKTVKSSSAKSSRMVRSASMPASLTSRSRNVSACSNMSTFARPDSVVGGRNVYTTRKNMGMNLAKEAPLEADVVVRCRMATPAALVLPGKRYSLRIRHHPEPFMSGAPSSTDSADPRVRREAEAFG